MKRKLLLLFVCLFGALGGVKAYTVGDLTTAGWTKVTAISNVANNDNYVGKFVYVLVDAGSSNYVMSRNPNDINARPKYITLDNPITNTKFVWTLEVRSDGYALRNIESQYYFNGGTYGWDATNKMAATYDNNASFTFTLVDSENKKYSLQRATGTASPGMYVGPWNDGGSVASTGEDVATNKNEGKHPDFYIYRMVKTTYLQKYLQQCPNVTSPVDASYLIVNPTIYQAVNSTTMPNGWSPFDVDSDRRTDESTNTGNTKLKIYKSGGGKGDYYQGIASLPLGLYRIKASLRDKNSRKVFKAYIYDTVTGERKVNSTDVGGSESDHTTDYLALNASNSVNVGVRTNDGTNLNGSTATADNFRMEVDPYISSMATAFTNGGEMTAGLWYHFTVANTGKHVLTATNLDDIIYATGETTALSAAGSSKISELQTLSANTDYYIRSSSNNTLTITPCISTVAEELPDNGAMTAGDWYYFDAPIDGNFYNFTATTLSDIVYTTNGDLASNTTSVTDDFRATDNSLTATRYYVKSATAQSLVMSMADGTDLTDLIKNPTCVDGVEGWEGGGTYADGGVEFFNTASYNFYQTLNNLPNGYYKLGAQAFYRDGDKSTTASACNAKLYAGSYEVDVMNINQYQAKMSDPGVGTWILPTGQPFYVPDNTQAADAALIVYEAYHNYVIAYVSNGSMTIGIKKNAEVGNDWTFMDNFTLTYLGTEIANEDFTYLIKEADCSTITQDYWLGSGRTKKTMEAYDGTTRSVFNANSTISTETKGGQRHQAITLPFAGAYKLTVFCKVPGTNNNGYAQIWVDDLGNNIDYTNARHLYTVNTSGRKTSTINSDGSGWYANEIYFTANANDSKTIYINLSEGDESLDYRNKLAYVSGMKLTYLGSAPEVSFDEAIVNPVVEVAHANVTIARNMKSDRWNTFTVPFSMAKPDGWTVKELTKVVYNESTNNYSLTFSDASSIVAGKAYMVKPESNVIEVSANNVTVNTSTVTSSQVEDGNHRANFVGNNSYMASAPTGSYIISNNVFYCVNSNVTQKGFRGYITVSNVSNNNNARATVSFGTDEDVTGIQNVVVEGLEESDALKDGKYLINGKIVIVKNGVKYDANGKKLN